MQGCRPGTGEPARETSLPFRVGHEPRRRRLLEMTTFSPATQTLLTPRLGVEKQLWTTSRMIPASAVFSPVPVHVSALGELQT